MENPRWVKNWQRGVEIVWKSTELCPVVVIKTVVQQNGIKPSHHSGNQSFSLAIWRVNKDLQKIAIEKCPFQSVSLSNSAREPHRATGGWAMDASW